MQENSINLVGSQQCAACDKSADRLAAVRMTFQPPCLPSFASSFPQLDAASQPSVPLRLPPRLLCQVDAMVTTFGELNAGMEQSGSFTMTRKKLFQLVAAANTTLTDVILRIGLLER